MQSMQGGERELAILKQDRLGRVRVPAEKREEILEAFDRSAMSAADFAAHVGVKYPTFANWIQRRRQKHKASSGGVRWMEAVVGEESGSGTLVVEFGGSCRMVVENAVGARLAAEVLRHLGRC
jgi:transposase-like protein